MDHEEILLRRTREQALLINSLEITICTLEKMLKEKNDFIDSFMRKKDSDEGGE